MIRKCTRFLVALLVALSGIIPAHLTAVFAIESTRMVDDNVIRGKHYFTYYGGEDFSGLKGWSDDPAKNLPAGADPALITQHWVWNDDGSASAYSYTFTFEGTGTALVGIANDKENTFQLDDEEPQTISIVGSGETTLYERKDLPFGKHTITVTLPEGKAYTGLQVSYANVYGAKEEAEKMETTKVLPSKTDGMINYFAYSAYDGKTWSKGDSEAYIDLGQVDAKAEECFYEIPFVGNTIEIFAIKSHNHGMVTYTVDGKEAKTVNLYNASRTQPQSVYKVEGLTEGEHVLKAVTKTEKDPASKTIVNQVSYALITHAPYAVNDVILENEQYVLAQGATQKIKYTFDPVYASLPTIRYESDDENIASVSEKGVITALEVGKTNITMYLDAYNIQKTIAIEVKPSTPGITGSIVDTNTQYTQDRYEEVLQLGLISKEVSAWKNDTAISEIALASKDSALKNVTITKQDLVSADAVISSDHMKATFIKSTMAYNGSYIGYGSTTRPVPEATEENRSESNDILYQEDPIDIPFNALQNIWVSFEVPKDAKPGRYQTEISVQADGIDTPLTFTYYINVQDAVLKDATEFKNSFSLDQWLYPYSSAEYYGVEPFSEKHFEVLRSPLEKYKAMGGSSITATISEDAWAGQTYSANPVHYPSMVTWTKQADDSFTYDYADFDAWIAYNKAMGLGSEIIVYSIAPWTNSFTYWDDGTLVKEGYTVGSARYKKVWTDFLQNFVDHLMDKGWFDDVYVAIDERGISATALDTVEAVKNIHGKSLKTAGSMDNIAKHHDLAMRITDLNIGDTAAMANPEVYQALLKERQEAGLRTTLYSCTEHSPGNFSLSAPVESYWVVANTGKLGADGFNRWAYDAWVEDPLRDTTHNAFEPGDCFLIYPDEKDVENPVSKSSVRLENIAAGMRDIVKLRMIAEEVPGLQAEIDATYANISGKVITSWDYLTEARIQELSDQVEAFKASLQTLTNQYIERKANGTDVVDSIAIKEGTSLSMQTGSTTQLHAVLMPENLLNIRVKWSSDPAIVSVDSQGMVTAHKAGTASVTATSLQDPSKTASIIITVSDMAVEDSAKVAYYPLDEAVNDVWNQYGGHVEGANFTSGKSGNALSINKAGERAVVEGDFGIGDTWSVGYWVYNTSSAQDRISTLMSEDGNYSFDLRLAADRPKAGVHVGKGGGDVLTFNYTAPVNEWIHLTWTQSKQNGLSLYVNGELIQTNAWTKTNAFPCPLYMLGAAAFTGKMDELKVYNRVLNTDEIASIMVVPGLNISEMQKALYVNEQYQIKTNLVSEEEDKTILYSSSNPEVASVSADGVVTAIGRGEAIITIENKAAGFKEEVIIYVQKKLNIANKLKEYSLPEENLSVIDKDLGGPRQYLGQPDMVMLDDNKTLISTYPVGHGKGPLVLKMSYDAGETWVEKTNLPASWAGSQETPVLYKLHMADGHERIMLITACPGWGVDSAGNATGWNTSYSDDGGETWSEYEHWYTNLADGTPNKSIVAMASLVQLKDEAGNDIQKWMGVYHNYDFVNYKTYLTFDENGNEQWSEPEPYLAEYRDIEASYQMCEIGMFRSPDGERIVGLARSQSHNNPATLVYSDDEGETWSRPMNLPGSLAGERHKAVYDPVSGRLLITFREILYDLNGNNTFDGYADWLAGDWVAWIGTYEDLMEQNEGQYRIVLAQDWANNAKSGDTGYAGVVAQPDGTFILHSYGHWDKDFSLSWGGGVTTDLCYIKQAKFKIGLMDQIAGLVDLSVLEKAIVSAEEIENDGYDMESWNVFMKALKSAKQVLEDPSSSQIVIDQALDALRNAQDHLSKEEVVLGKELLLSAVTKAQNADLTFVAPSVVEIFNIRLAQAKAVLNNPAATTQMYLDAWLDLANIMHYLDFKADKRDLEILVQECKKINMDEYTIGVEEFRAALKNAENVLADAGVLQESITNAYQRLELARNALVKNEVNKTLLRYVYDSIVQAVGNGNAYAKDTQAWLDFTTALETAYQLLHDESATQVAINQAFQALTNAYENIRLLPDEALLEALQNFINTLENIDLTRFHAGQVRFIKQTKARALQILNDPSQSSTVDKVSLLQDIDEIMQMLEGVRDEVKDPTITTPLQPATTQETSTPQQIIAVKGTTKTGDTTQMVYVVGGMLMSAFAIAGIRRKRK